MDPLSIVTKPLKWFLYNSREFAKSIHKDKNSSIEDSIRMSDIDYKSIMRSPTKLNQSTNLDDCKSVKNVLFDESTETKLNSSDFNENKRDSINLNSSEPEKLIVKVLDEPVLKLNLNNMSDLDKIDNTDKLNKTDPVEKIKQRSSVIKIKVKVAKNKLNSVANEISQQLPNANIVIMEKQENNKNCIFDENCTRPLSPILAAPLSSPIVNFRPIDDLINFHEDQIKPSKTKQPLMGTHALLNRSPPSKQIRDDSQIISELVRDRFVVNMYESRSLRHRSVKKPSRYGRFYRSLERSVANDREKIHFTKTNSITSIKQSSPIQLKDQPVSLTLNRVETEINNQSNINNNPLLNCDDVIRTDIIQKLADFAVIQDETEMKNFIEEKPILHHPTDEPEVNTKEELVSCHQTEENTSVLKKQITVIEKIPHEDCSVSKTEETNPIENCSSSVMNTQDHSPQKIEETPQVEVFPTSRLELAPKSETKTEEFPQEIDHVIEVFSSSKLELAAESTKEIDEQFVRNTPKFNPIEKILVDSTEFDNISTDETDSNSIATTSDLDLTQELVRNHKLSTDEGIDCTHQSKDSIDKILLEHPGTDVSYNMDEFLEKALGDELCNYSNLDSTSDNLSKTGAIASKPILHEDSICTSDASALVSKVNSIQSNFYRSLTKKLQFMSDTMKYPGGKKPEVDTTKFDDDFDTIFPNNEQVTELVRQAAVQFEAMKQITKALAVCRNTKEFTVSSEQVEGERLLLVATYKRQAILDEIRRLDYDISEHPVSSSETGTLVISDVTLPIKSDSAEQLPTRRDQIQWYVAIFSNGPQAFATQPTLAKPDGNVRFTEEIIFNELPSDYSINVEVYSLVQRRPGRNFSHESKYHINKGTKSSHCPTPKKFLHREKQSQKIPPRYDNGIRTSSFKLSGCLKLRVSDLTKTDGFFLRKVPLCSLLEGSIQFKMQSCVDLSIKHSGFLNIGTQTGGSTAWNRRWCVLQGHLLKYWNYPSDEDSCSPLKEIDLKYCKNGDIKLADRIVCAKPRTLLVEIASSNNKGHFERFLFAVDTISEFKTWEMQLNIVVSTLRTWNVGN